MSSRKPLRKRASRAEAAQEAPISDQAADGLGDLYERLRRAYYAGVDAPG